MDAGAADEVLEVEAELDEAATSAAAAEEATADEASIEELATDDGAAEESGSDEAAADEAAAEDGAAGDEADEDAAAEDAAAEEEAGAEDEATALEDEADAAALPPEVLGVLTMVQVCRQAEGRKQFHQVDQEQVAGVHLTVTAEGEPELVHQEGKLCGGLQLVGRDALGLPPLHTLRLYRL